MGCEQMKLEAVQGSTRMKDPILDILDETIREIRSWRRELKELRLGIPIFEGQDAYGWLNKVEKYFDAGGVCEEEDRTPKVAQWMSGSALTWYRLWVWINPNATWGEFREAILKRFQPEHDLDLPVWIHKDEQESLEKDTEKKDEGKQKHGDEGVTDNEELQEARLKRHEDCLEKFLQPNQGNSGGRDVNNVVGKDESRNEGVNETIKGNDKEMEVVMVEEADDDEKTAVVYKLAAARQSHAGSTAHKIGTMTDASLPFSPPPEPPDRGSHAAAGGALTMERTAKMRATWQSQSCSTAVREGTRAEMSLQEFRSSFDLMGLAQIGEKKWVSINCFPEVGRAEGSYELQGVNMVKEENAEKGTYWEFRKVSSQFNLMGQTHLFSEKHWINEDKEGETHLRVVQSCKASIGPQYKTLAIYQNYVKSGPKPQTLIDAKPAAFGVSYLPDINIKRGCFLFDPGGTNARYWVVWFQELPEEDTIRNLIWQWPFKRKPPLFAVAPWDPGKFDDSELLCPEEFNQQNIESWVAEGNHIPVNRKAEFLPWFSASMSLDESQDLRRCLRKIVAEENLLQKFIFTWMEGRSIANSVENCVDHSQVRRSPSSLTHQFGKVKWACESTATGKKEYSGSILEVSDKKDFNEIATESRKLQLSGDLTNLSAFKERLQFIAAVCLFHSIVEHKIIFSAVDEEFSFFQEHVEEENQFSDFSCLIESIQSERATSNSEAGFYSKLCSHTNHQMETRRRHFHMKHQEFCTMGEVRHRLGKQSGAGIHDRCFKQWDPGGNSHIIATNSMILATTLAAQASCY